LAVVERALQHWHLVQLGDLGGAPAALAGDDLMHARPRRVRTHEDGLQDAVAADRLGQPLELPGIEIPPGLLRIRLELADRQVALAPGRQLSRRCRALPQQRREPAAEPALRFGAHALSRAACGVASTLGPGSWRRSSSPASWI